MKCLVEPLMEVGDPCSISSCWMHNSRALGNCMIHDSGHTEITKFDIARINGIKERAAQEMVDAGKDKLALWLKLVDAAECIPLGSGCGKCGRVNCAGDGTCQRVENKIVEISKRTPLADVVEMNAEKWRGLMTDHALLLQQVLRMLERPDGK